MTDSNALDDEMRNLRRLLGLEPDPLALDEGTAERLLAGQLHPADAPPEYRCAAMVLAATAAPPSPDELAGESEAVSAFRAVARSSLHHAGSRRPTVPTRFLSLKLAAAVAIAALSVAGVAGAATGTLPDAAQRVAHKMLGAAGVPSADDRGSRGGGASAGKPSSKSDNSPTGPDVTGPAKAGLCRAWAAGQGTANGGKADSTAFEALAKAAGGADRIAAFCADVLKPTHEPQGTPSGAGADHAQGQGSGADHGQGSGQGQGNGGGQGSGEGNGHGSPPPSTGPRSHG